MSAGIEQLTVGFVGCVFLGVYYTFGSHGPPEAFGTHGPPNVFGTHGPPDDFGTYGPPRLLAPMVLPRCLTPIRTWISIRVGNGIEQS